MTVLMLKDHAEFLGTRALGERVRSQILELLRSSPERIVLDFGGVRVMTQSFADEVFRKLREEIPEDQLSRLTVRNLTEDVRSVLRYATSKAEPSAP